MAKLRSIMRGLGNLGRSAEAVQFAY